MFDKKLIFTMLFLGSIIRHSPVQKTSVYLEQLKSIFI